MILNLQNFLFEIYQFEMLDENPMFLRRKHFSKTICCHLNDENIVNYQLIFICRSFVSIREIFEFIKRMI